MLSQEELDARVASREIAINAAEKLSKATWSLGGSVAGGHASGYLDMPFVGDQAERTVISKAFSNKTRELVAEIAAKSSGRSIADINDAFWTEMSPDVSEKHTRITGHPPLLGAVQKEAEAAVKAQRIPKSFKGFMPTAEEKVNRMFTEAEWTPSESQINGAPLMQAKFKVDAMDDEVRAAFSQMLKTETSQAFEAAKGSGETVAPVRFSNHGDNWVVTIGAQVHEQIAARIADEGHQVDEAVQARLQSKSGGSPAAVIAARGQRGLGEPEAVAQWGAALR